MLVHTRILCVTVDECRWVAVYNQRSSPELAYLLGKIEIWVSELAPLGARLSEPIKCGEARYESTHEPQPYLVGCDGMRGRYVIVRQTPDQGAALPLGVAEVEVYAPGAVTTTLVPDAAPDEAQREADAPQIVPLGAESSSVLDPEHPPFNCIDHDLSTVCSSTSSLNAWLAIQLPPNSRVGRVLVYNERSDASFTRLLGSFEVWASSEQPRPGDATENIVDGGVRCGEATFNPHHEPAPYDFSCDGTRATWVTIVQTGDTVRHLVLAEVRTRHAHAMHTRTRTRTIPSLT